MNHAGAKFDDYLGSSYPHCMYVNPTCVSEIKNILSAMQSKNSCGLGEIPMSILKSSPGNILFILCPIFNLLLGQRKFINDYKKARIIPVHKKGFKTDVNNLSTNQFTACYVQNFEKNFLQKAIFIFEPSRFFSININSALEKNTPQAMLSQL